MKVTIKADNAKQLDNGAYKIGKTFVLVHKEKELIVFGNPQTKKQKSKDLIFIQNDNYVESIGVNNVDRNGGPYSVLMMTIEQLEQIVTYAKKRKGDLKKSLGKNPSAFFIHPSPDLSICLVEKPKRRKSK